MKECYVKCASNEQAQALRPYLVEVGFVDDKEWNNERKCEFVRYAICIYDDMSFNLQVLEDDEFSENTHTVPADADLAEAAKTIKELFDKL